MNDAALQPIVKRLTLRASPQRAFTRFTANIAVWWPLAEFSLSRKDAVDLTFEARPGGAIFETDNTGRRREWGRVLVCEPPRRLVFSWVLERVEGATEVEVLFEPGAAGATELTLIHRGWDGAASRGGRRESYEHGWPTVLAAFVASL